MSDVAVSNTEIRSSKFLSRALAAFAVAAIAKTDDVTAAQSVVDEFHDDGIDAFYFDRTEHIAYIVQSKWIKDGNGSPDLGSILKFIQGINHLLEDKTSELGSKMQAKASDIQDVLADSQSTFVLIVAYTSKDPLATEVAGPLNHLMDELNDDGDLVTLQLLKQKELHDIVELGAMGSSVDLTVMLHEFGKVDHPYTAYYGHAHVSDLVAWGKYGDRLYHKNIRGFKGSTDVNDAIVETIKTAAQHFFVF